VWCKTEQRGTELSLAWPSLLSWAPIVPYFYGNATQKQSLKHCRTRPNSHLLIPLIPPSAPLSSLSSRPPPSQVSRSPSFLPLHLTGQGSGLRARLCLFCSTVDRFSITFVIFLQCWTCNLILSRHGIPRKLPLWLSLRPLWCVLSYNSTYLGLNSLSSGVHHL
jgi:hypothetical protein